MSIPRPAQPEDKYMDSSHSELLGQVVELPDTYLWPGERRPSRDTLEDWPVSTLALWLAQHEVENPHLHLD